MAGMRRTDTDPGWVNRELRDLRRQIREQAAAKRVIGALADAGWVPLSFSNGWVNFGGATYTPAAYRKVGNRVELRGLVKSGTLGASICSALPADTRPPFEQIRVVASNDAFGEVRVTQAGTVNPTIGSNIWVCLDGISWYVD